MQNTRRRHHKVLMELTSVVQNGVDHPPAAASLMERNVDAPDGLKSLPRGFVLDDTDK